MPWPLTHDALPFSRIFLGVPGRQVGRRCLEFLEETKAVRSGFKKELLALERYKEENIRMVFFDAEDFAKFIAHRPRGCARYLRDFRTAWRSALEKAKVKEYRFHDFCRTATRNMALAGVPEKHIMQVTGHKTTAMLKRDNITVEQDIHNTLVRT